jgi:hypothetical protein
LLHYIHQRGVRILTANGNTLTDSGDLFCKIKRQIAYAFHQHESARLMPGCTSATLQAFDLHFLWNRNQTSVAETGAPALYLSDGFRLYAMCLQN